jgi:hypothetical protein
VTLITVARADGRQQQRRDGEDDQPTTASRCRIGLMRGIAIFIDEIEDQRRGRAGQRLMEWSAPLLQRAQSGQNSEC